MLAVVVLVNSMTLRHYQPTDPRYLSGANFRYRLIRESLIFATFQPWEWRSAYTRDGLYASIYGTCVINHQFTQNILAMKCWRAGVFWASWWDVSRCSLERRTCSRWWQSALCVDRRQRPSGRTSSTYLASTPSRLGRSISAGCAVNSASK